MDLKLKNRKALITGSTSGIGYAIARQLLQEGANVVVTGRSDETVSKAVQSLKEEIKDAAVDGFIVDFKEVDQVNELLRKLPEVDILINNVGVYEMNDFFDINDEDWSKLFEINIMSGVRLARQYMLQMKKNDWGRIIFISSESALNVPEEMVHYGMTKAAQLAVSRGLAEYTKGTNVTVNSVLPGPTFTDTLEDFLKPVVEEEDMTMQEFKKVGGKKLRPTSLIERLIEPEEVAAMVAYVASPLSSATNGAALRVDGGIVRHIA